MYFRITFLLVALLLGACATTPSAPMPDQPGLARAVQPYTDQFRSLGVSRVTSPGGGGMLRLNTGYGDVYVRYPAGVAPMAFVLEIDSAGSKVRSESSDEMQFRQLFAAFAPEAVRVTAANNEFGWSRANPWR